MLMRRLHADYPLRRNGEYPAFDGLGSARAETNAAGTVTATQDFDAFGNTIASSGSTSSPYNFAADWAFASLACPERSRGGDAGLQHVGARYYDPQVGRFASRDNMLDQIPYAYCGGEPNDWLDPSGCKPNWLSVLAKIGEGVVALSPAIEIGYTVYEVVDGLHKGYEARRRFQQMRRSPLPTWIARRGDDGNRRVDPGWRSGVPDWSNNPTPWLPQ